MYNNTNPQNTILILGIYRRNLHKAWLLTNHCVYTSSKMDTEPKINTRHPFFTIPLNP